MFLEKISELLIRDNVNYICDDAFLGTENLKSVYILPLTIDLTNSGIGYKTGEKNIYGITALGISAAVLSVVSSKKKRNRNN